MPTASTATTAAHQIPPTMRCVVYGKSEPHAAMVPTPSPGHRNHILVRVVTAGLNPVDAKNIVGDKLPETWTFLRQRARSYIADKIPGFDFAGICMEHAHGFAHGDKVFGIMPPFHGTLAEYISVPLDQICYMPKNYSFAQAAALPLVGLTALQAMKPHVTRGCSVLVLGASGGTGHVMLQMAKNCLGAEHVVAVCSNSNAEFCRSCGATQVVAYDTNTNNADVVTDLAKSNAKPFSVVMDCVTSADSRDQALNYPMRIQQASSLLLTDDYGYRRLGGPSLDWIRAGLERSMGLNCWRDRHEKLFWIRFPNSAAELGQLQQWAEAGLLRPHVSQTFDFPEGVKDAFDALLSRRVKGKVIVNVWPEYKS